MNNIEVKKLVEEAKLPVRAYPSDAGLDLYSLDTQEVLPGEGYKFSTGVAFNIPKGYYLHIHTRSSMARDGWTVVGGICDESYKGEAFVFLRNISNKPLIIEKGNRIAQAVIYPIALPHVVEVSDIGSSSRGIGAFGSTGK
jgi:dUTP pyrophosphatase